MLSFFSFTMHAQTAAEFADLWEKQHISTILPSNMRHRDVKAYVAALDSSGVKTAEVGRSFLNKEIYQLEFGRGPLKVFMWSQMHGDEPTATPALVDMFSILQRNSDQDWVKRLSEKITIRAVPMLNPDGSDLYVRRNMQGLDINRDAVELKSPEARLLKKLRDEWSPEIGFNLHNQNALTTVGSTAKQAGLSFLVVYGDPQKTPSEGHERNKKLVSAMLNAVSSFMPPGHIGRYSDEWTPNAFGDNFSAWGTPTILIETGALHTKDEMFLVKMNFISYLAALQALADGTEKQFSPLNYEQLPHNSSGRLVNFIFRGASIVNKADPANIKIADIGAAVDRRRAEFSASATIRRIGDLKGLAALEEFDAKDFYVIGRFQALAVGGTAEMLFFRKDRQIDWASEDLEKQVVPDAIFSLGKWLKGEGIVPRK